MDSQNIMRLMKFKIDTNVDDKMFKYVAKRFNWTREIEIIFWKFSWEVTSESDFEVAWGMESMIISWCQINNWIE